MKRQIIRSFMFFALGAAAIFLLGGCKQSIESSRLRNADSCNLSDMGVKSAKASAQAFDCAYSALRTAGDLGSGFAAQIITVVDGIKDIVAFATSAAPTIEMIGQGLAEINQINGGATDNFNLTGKAGLKLSDDNEEDGSTSTDDVLNKAEEVGNQAKDVKNALKSKCKSLACQCVAESVPLFNTFVAIAQTGNSLNKKGSYSAEDIKDIIGMPQSAITGIQSIFKTSSLCAQALNGRSEPEYEKALAGFKKVTSITQTVTVFAKCSVDLVGGGYVLYQNMQCLAEDIQRLEESGAMYQKLKDNYTASVGPSNNSESGKCNGEPDGQNLRAMRKFGIWIYKTTKADPRKYANFYPSDCGVRCSSKSLCEENALEIFGDGDYSACKHTCGITQSEDAISACLTGCCNASSYCVQEARQYFSQ